MKYKCQFPGCSYQTNVKSQINFHHIVPRELNGEDKSYNIIQLCPTHHTKIFIPQSNKGIHTFESDDSVIILCWRNNKSILEYINCFDKKLKYFNYK